MNQWTGYPPLPTSRRQMASYVCSWIPVTSMRPSAIAIITRHPLWRKLLTSLCTLSLLHQVGCPPWILLSHPQPGVKLAYDFQQSLSEETVSCNFALAWSVPKTSSRRRWIRSSKNAKDVLESQTTSLSMAALRWTMMPCLRDLMQIACKYDLVFNPQKTHVKAQAINFFGCLYDANGVHPDLGKVNAVHALLSTQKHHRTSRVLRPSHIP